MLINPKAQYPDLERSDVLLRIDGVLMPRWTMHGVSESWEMQTAGELARSVSGPLIAFTAYEIGDPYNETYTITLSGDDRFLPWVMSWKPFVSHRIESMHEIPLPGKVDKSLFPRLHVPGSIVYRDLQRRALPGDGEGATTAADADIASTCFRPVVTGMIQGKSFSTRPWGDAKNKTHSVTFIEDEILPIPGV